MPEHAVKCPPKFFYLLSELKLFVSAKLLQMFLICQMLPSILQTHVESGSHLIFYGVKSVFKKFYNRHNTHFCKFHMDYDQIISNLKYK